jgi:uncharacterized sporulation protein YeaH/YhbH (DUF444 family)
MSINIVDKRTINHDRTTENRQRFLKRIKATIKEQLPKIIGGRSLKDIDKTGGKIKVLRKTINEPVIHHGNGGNNDRVLPGNDKFVEGDTIPKPDGEGQGQRGTRGDDGEDEFIVELSREEFLNYFFEDLELPDLTLTELSKLKEYKRENAGFQPDGSPNRLRIERSFRQSLGRRITIRSGIDKKIKMIENTINDLEYSKFDQVAKYTKGELLEITSEISKFKIELEKLQKRRERIPLFEEMDLRYQLSVRHEIAVTHATMVMIMDNSGSMGQKEKTIARKFFWLLYSFLSRQYEAVDMVFISHTESAVEMEEEEFFNTNINGGTIVSSALDLASDIIKERLVNKTNIYIAQVSDGDNTDTDNGTCTEILEDDILPFVRYFAYVQVDSYHSSALYENGLWKSYKEIASKNSRLQIKRVLDERDIYLVFRQLLLKKSKKTINNA